MNGRPALLFVYNADSGLFNTLADIGHKIFSPATYECALCALTHGYFSERQEWRTFVEGLPCDCEFLHRDQFLARYPDQRTDLPAVFVKEGAGLSCCLGPEALRGCADLEALQRLIAGRCCRPGT